MKTYFANIFTTIGQYSKKLDELTLLLNQNWVLLDTSSANKTVLIFKEKNKLLISENGIVEKSNWEYASENSMIIDFKGKSYLFKHGFLDNAILALKVDSKLEYAVFINETKANRELNTLNTIVDYLNEKYVSNPITKNVIYLGDTFSFKMGYYKEYKIEYSDGRILKKIYQRYTDNKYFIYGKDDIILFDDLETCINNIHLQEK